MPPNPLRQTGQPQPPRPIARADIVRIASGMGVPVDVIEKDYVLSYLLAGTSSVPALAGLRFKGGTALKKMIFGPSYRFSEDLDFSAVGVPQGQAIVPHVAAAVQAVERRLGERGRFRVEFDRMPERDPHPTGQDSFRVRVAFPWQSTPQVRVKLEITHDEPVLLATQSRLILHGYDQLGEYEALAAVEVETYALEEIVAEKLRALRQTQQRLEARGWNRPRARDYYDLWRLLSDFGAEINAPEVRRILPAKMAHRGVRYRCLEDFFTEQLVSEARRHWLGTLGTFVSPLPDLEVVLAELRPLIAALLELS